MTRDAGPIALVLAGAVAKGAFHAGVVQALSGAGTRITTLLGTSAGALTAALLGAGIASDRVERATGQLAQLWTEQATWSSFVDVAPGSVMRLRGLSSTRRIREMLGAAMDAVLRGASPSELDVRVGLITTALDGAKKDDVAGVTYELARTFRTADFFDAERRRRIAEHATASAAFPFLFAPHDLDGAGPCIDGGAVNNTPMGYAVLDRRVRRIVVVTPHDAGPPAAPAGGWRGLDLLGQAVDILINERLHRDVQYARKVNAKLEAVRRALDGAPDADATFERVAAALRWRDLPIDLVRPERPLEGNSFDGFGDRDLRVRYVEAGVAAGESLLARWAS